jgi:hypothetical protein
MQNDIMVNCPCRPAPELQAWRNQVNRLGNDLDSMTRQTSQLPHGFVNLYNFEPNCSPYAEAVLGYAAGMSREAIRCDAAKNC